MTDTVLPAFTLLTLNVDKGNLITLANWGVIKILDRYILSNLQEFLFVLFLFVIFNEFRKWHFDTAEWFALRSQSIKNLSKYEYFKIFSLIQTISIVFGSKSNRGYFLVVFIGTGTV